MVIDDYYIKVPTCVQDVARVIFDLMGMLASLQQSNNSYHYSQEKRVGSRALWSLPFQLRRKDDAL